MTEFKLHSEFKPQGDQPQAINGLVQGLNSGDRHQVLLGITGSGKTFTMANVIEKVQRPTLIISHNKTLAAQLYGEFKQLFPENAVEYFISYYDYYQPEAYLPVTDTFIEKDMSVNEEIDILRLKATSSLLSRRDTIVVSSVSCIYGIGSPDEYKDKVIHLKRGAILDRKFFFKSLSEKKLYVCDHFSTTYAEALAANVPTILFWNPEFNELRPETRLYFDLLLLIFAE